VRTCGGDIAVFPTVEKVRRYSLTKLCTMVRRYRFFGRRIVKRFALCYRNVVLSCLSVCDVGVLWPKVGRIKMKFGTHVGLGPGHIVLDGNPVLLSKKVAQPPKLSAHVRCGQTAGWINIPLGMEVGLGPGDFVLDGEPAPPPKRRHSTPILAHVLWPSGRMDQDATWYGGRPHPRPHCVTWGPSSS